MQSNLWLPVAVALPLLGAVLAYILGRRRARWAVWSMLIASAADFVILSAVLWQAAHGRPSAFAADGLCVTGIALYADGFRALYAWLAALLWGVASVFSFSYFNGRANLPRYAFFSLLTLSATVGVFLSDQLLSTAMFFEVMSLASYPWVAHEETPEAMRAAQSYLWFAIIGGMCMLMGLLLLPQELILARYSTWQIASDGASRLMLPATLILIAFGVKAGAFPLHTWLPKAYPAAPAPATALLSAVLSKAGIFGILLLSAKIMPQVAAWHTLIFWNGVATMVWGGVLALLSTDIRRVLACSSMSQIGFILVGAGVYGLLQGGGTAAQGIAAHMVNHSALKMILFLCAGVVAMNLGKTGLNDVRGYGRGKPLLHFVFLTGVIGLAGVPLGPGFLSKSLLHEGLGEVIRMLPGGAWAYTAAEWLFILSGGLTLAYMLKLYICLFWERGPARQPATRYLTKASAAALAVAAASVWMLGLFPQVFLRGIGKLGAEFLRAEAEPVVWFSGENLLGAAKSIAAGLLIYLLVVRGLLSVRTEGGRGYRNIVPERLNLEDLLYRPVLRAAVALVTAFSWTVSQLPELLIAGLRRILLHVRAWRVPMPGGNRITCAVGEFLNNVVLLLNKTVLKNRPASIDFSCALAAGNEELGRSVKRVKRSLSYSLLLFCTGLFALLFYLVLW